MKNICAAIVAFAVLATPALADRKLDEAVAKAEEQFQKGKTDEALKTLQKIVSQNTTSPEAHVALARLQERLGSLEDAAATLAKAVDLASAAAAPVRAEALSALASMDLLQGSGRDAVAHADQAVQAQATPATFAVLARAQARVQDPIKALATAESAVLAAATSAAAHEARGEALMGLRRADDAAGAFRKALELDPKLNLARIGLASALLAQGKAAEAVAEARKATEADPRSGEAFAVLGTAILAQNPKDWNDAISQAQQGKFLNARNALVLFAVGKIFETEGNLTQAEGAYREAAKVDPAYVPARAASIQIQVRRGDLDGALAEAQKLATEAPQSGEAQLQLGRVLLRKSDFAGAVTALERAVELGSSLAEAHALLGTAYQYARRTAAAVVAYTRATDLDPTNLDYRTTYGLLLGVNKQQEAGIAELKRVIATPGYKRPDAWVNLGWIYRNTEPKRTEESVAAYKKALELDPKNQQAALGLGWAYSYLRKWDEAIASFNKAIELDPPEPQPGPTHAVGVKIGDQPEVRVETRTLPVSGSPRVSGEAYNGIAWCYFFKKDMPQARAAMEKAQAAGRNDPRLKAQIERVEKALAAGQAAATEEALAEREKTEKEEGPDVAALCQTLRSGDPAARRRAARELAGAGRDAVSCLIWALKDKDWSVREAAVASMGAIGPAARDAIPHLREILNSDKPVKPIPTPAEVQEMMRDEDYRRAVRDALQKIQR